MIEELKDMKEIDIRQAMLAIHQDKDNWMHTITSSILSLPERRLHRLLEFKTQEEKDIQKKDPLVIAIIADLARYQTIFRYNTESLQKQQKRKHRIFMSLDFIVEEWRWLDWREYYTYRRSTI